jgi:heme exporter protein CcmD
MIALGEHWEFIAGAWGAALFGALALIVWTLAAARRQQARLKALEASGLRRRSDPS